MCPFQPTSRNLSTSQSIAQQPPTNNPARTSQFGEDSAGQECYIPTES
ncbi:hypothetical protein PSTT_14045 [Puccinia striiformis]|uniref:Uncharacterized protein n=1 Tax=Puccinia striiformis TaxID=27350 RepID=A0A2S4UP87_9BASI|nr:hypothetical protein PSTT_14045 [Puccinia striiformis]